MSMATGTLSKGPYSALASRSVMSLTLVSSPERLMVSANSTRTSCWADSSSSARNSRRSMVTTCTTRLSTRTRPLASKMRPRGASVYTTRKMLAEATVWNSSCSSTCRYQSRANKAATRHTATIPIT